MATKGKPKGKGKTVAKVTTKNAVVIRDNLPPAPNMMQVIARAAADPRVDVEKMERLLAMQERLMVTEAKAKFTEEFVRLQSALPVMEQNGRITIYKKDAPKTAANLVQSTPYAKWEDINDVLKPILKEHGFALSFKTDNAPDGKLIVTGILKHGTYQEESTLTLPFDVGGSKNNVQAVGSAVTDGKRDVATALINLGTRFVEDQDDDAMASGQAQAISKDQLTELIERCEKLNVDKIKFCNHLKIDALALLPVSRFGEANAALDQKANAGSPPQ